MVRLMEPKPDYQERRLSDSLELGQAAARRERLVEVLGVAVVFVVALLLALYAG